MMPASSALSRLVRLLPNYSHAGAWDVEWMFMAPIPQQAALQLHTRATSSTSATSSTQHSGVTAGDSRCYAAGSGMGQTGTPGPYGQVVVPAAATGLHAPYGQHTSWMRQPTATAVDGWQLPARHVHTLSWESVATGTSHSSSSSSSSTGGGGGGRWNGSSFHKPRQHASQQPRPRKHGPRAAALSEEDFLNQDVSHRFGPSAKPLAGQSGDFLSKAILSTTSQQQLQHLMDHPVSPWQPQHMVLALTQLPQLAGRSRLPSTSTSRRSNSSGSSSSISSAGSLASLSACKGDAAESAQPSGVASGSQTTPAAAAAAAAAAAGGTAHLVAQLLQLLRDASATQQQQQQQGPSGGSINPWSCLSPYQLSRFMQAAAGMQLTDPELWRGCLDAMVQHGGTASPPSISSALAALAAVTRSSSRVQADPQQVRALVTALCQQLPRVPGFHLSNALTSLSHLSVKVDRATYTMMLGAFCGQHKLLQPISISNFLWASATAGYVVPQQQVDLLLKAQAASLAANGSDNTAVTRTLWSLAKMQMPVQPASLLQQLQQDLVSSARHGTVSGLAAGVYGLAKLKKLGLMTDQQLLPGLVGVVLRQTAANLPDLALAGLSNVLWAAAVLRQEVDPEVLGALVQGFTSKLAGTNGKTQEVANALWACTLLYSSLGSSRSSRSSSSSSSSSSSFSVEACGSDLDNALGAAPTAAAEPRAFSPTYRNNQEMPSLTAAQQRLLPVVSEARKRCLDYMAQHAKHAAAQELSIALWAAFHLRREPPPSYVMAAILDAFARLVQQQQHSTCDITNALWAAAQFRWYPEKLLGSWQYAVDLQQADHRELSVMAMALPRLGFGDEQLGAVMLARAEQLFSGSSRSTSSWPVDSRAMQQMVASVAWATAMLDCRGLRQRVWELSVPVVQQAAAQLPFQELVMWRQVHVWFIDTQGSSAAPAAHNRAPSLSSGAAFCGPQHEAGRPAEAAEAAASEGVGGTPGAQGLAAVLDAEAWGAVEAAWTDQAEWVRRTGHSKLQMDVYRAVNKLQAVLPGLAVTGFEQPDNKDGYLTIDIVAAYKGHLLAIEVDGPRHWLAPDQRPVGTTLHRNRGLAVRGYTVVVVHGKDWDELTNMHSKLQYLCGCIQQVLGEPLPKGWQEACRDWYLACSSGQQQQAQRRKGEQHGRHRKPKQQRWQPEADEWWW